MKKFLAALALASALTLPTIAEARSVTFTTELANYGGNGAYLALYLTDSSGQFHSTIWVAGGRARYYKHLRDWVKLSGAQGIDGITGASVGGGRVLTVTADIADALIDAGYEIHVDAAVEDYRDSPSEIVVPLTSAGTGRTDSGTSYIAAFKYDM